MGFGLLVRVGLFGGILTGSVATGQGKTAPVAPPPPVAKAGGDAAGRNAEGKPDKLMTPVETKKLLDSVDTVMGFVSKDTGLAPAKVKRRVLGGMQ